MRRFIYLVSGVGCLVLIAAFALLPSMNHTPLAVRYTDTRSKTFLNETDSRIPTPVTDFIQTTPARHTTTLPPEFGPWHRNIPEKLYMLAKEAFDVIPKTFLPGYKSPCFFVNGPGNMPRLRCLPYFYLIGIQKCGTTDVWDKITSHPSIVRTAKEPHYWARYRVLSNVSIHIYLSQPSSKLVKGFADGETKKRELITCDGSTSALGDNRWQNMTFDPYDGPEYVVADIMREIQPDSKHIIVLRDPITRTYSDFRFFGGLDGKFRNGGTPERFHQYVKDDIEQFNNCTKNRSPRACAYLLGRFGTRTLFSYYAIYVRDWLKVFPRDQLYILRTEDWQTNCTVHLQEIFTFLELDDLPLSELSSICNQTKMFVNSNHHRPMLQETKHLLEDFFLEKNQELTHLLSDDRFLWT